MLGQLIVPITEERMKNDVAWLQWLQDLFDKIQGFGKPENQIKGVLLTLEGLFWKARGE